MAIKVKKNFRHSIFAKLKISFLAMLALTILSFSVVIISKKKIRFRLRIRLRIRYSVPKSRRSLKKKKRSSLRFRLRIRYFVPKAWFDRDCKRGWHAVQTSPLVAPLAVPMVSFRLTSLFWQLPRSPFENCGWGQQKYAAVRKSPKKQRQWVTKQFITAHLNHLVIT